MRNIVQILPGHSWTYFILSLETLNNHHSPLMLSLKQSAKERQFFIANRYLEASFRANTQVILDYD